MWLKPQGYAEIISDGNSEAHLDHLQIVKCHNGANGFDTCRCGHCGFMFHVGARQRPEDIGGMCAHCWKPICPKCLDKPCVPFEQHVDAIENAVQKQKMISEWF